MSDQISPDSPHTEHLPDVPPAPTDETASEATTFLARLTASFERSSWHWLFAILICTAALYVQTFGFDLVFDDHFQIENNTHVHSWRYVGKAFTEHVWSGQKDFAVTNSYRPVFLIWLTANYSVFGADPRGWHVTTVLMYLAAVAGVWWLASEVLGRGGPHIVATLVFALHPIHVESVAWIGAVIDSLLVTFFIAAMMFYFRATDDRSKFQIPSSKSRNQWLSVFFLVLALLTKEFAVFWVPMVFLYEAFVRRHRDGVTSRLVFWGSILRSMMPHLAVTALYFVVHKLVIPASFVGNTRLTWPVAVFTVPLVLLNYFKLLVWPVHLRIEYELFYVGAAWSPWFWGPLAVLVLLAAASLAVRGQYPLIWVLGVWMVLPLVPTLNLWHFRQGEFLHDRYLFLPSLAFALLVGWLFGERQKAKVGDSQIENQKSKIENELPTAYCLLPAVLLAVILIPLNLIQIPMWSNDIVLFGEVLRYHPNHLFALQNLAVALRDQKFYAEELVVLQRMIAVDPTDLKFRYGLAGAYFRAKRYPELVDVLTYLEAHDPNFKNDGYNCFLLGYAQLATNHPSESRPLLERAVALDGKNPQYWYTLGDAYAKLNLTTEAVHAYRTVLTLDDRHAAAVQQKITQLESGESEVKNPKPEVKNQKQ